MNFDDIFKSGFLDSMVAASIPTIILTMAVSLVLGIFIYFIYRKSFKGVMYSSSFAVTLVALTLTSTVVILAVSSNVVLSLGMVGALSIVRFRSAIKDPLDLSFLFWAITVGIVLAAGMIPLALIGSVVIGVVLLLFANRKPLDTPYILVISAANQKAEVEIDKMLDGRVRKKQIKSKTVTPEQIELNYEVRLSGGDTNFINDLSKLSGVKNTVLVSYSGDYMG
jgi:uncharacterized membrane protein YhiD involved in acid resistance